MCKSIIKCPSCGNLLTFSIDYSGDLIADIAGTCSCGWTCSYSELLLGVETTAKHNEELRKKLEVSQPKKIRKNIVQMPREF
jgi:hypothetical protein